jgi:FAD/FMN-containing dehydrogenase
MKAVRVDARSSTVLVEPGVTCGEVDRATQEHGRFGRRIRVSIHAYGDNFQRLRQLKSEWDPGNLFRVNHNIRPRT